jgi:hypothetical protein
MSEDNIPAGNWPGPFRQGQFLAPVSALSPGFGMALAGVAYANRSQKSLAGYWELLALISGGVCIFTEWEKLEDKQARVRLVWTQAIHWIAVLVARSGCGDE